MPPTTQRVPGPESLAAASARHDDELRALREAVAELRALHAHDTALFVLVKDAFEALCPILFEASPAARVDLVRARVHPLVGSLSHFLQAKTGFPQNPT